MLPQRDPAVGIAGAKTQLTSAGDTRDRTEQADQCPPADAAISPMTQSTHLTAHTVTRPLDYRLGIEVVLCSPSGLASRPSRSRYSSLSPMPRQISEVRWDEPKV